MANRPCTVERCDRGAIARGWCSTHYARWRKHGSTDYWPKGGPEKSCSVDGCDKRHRAKGLCSWHYQQKDKAPTRSCSVDGCDNAAAIKAMCRPHYARCRAGTDLTAPMASYRTFRKTVEVVERDKLGRKLCTTCNTWIAESEFGRHFGAADLLNARCRMCVRAVRYGIDRTGLLELFSEQGSKCSVCLVEGDVEDMVIDHDHQCCPGSSQGCPDCLRGLLCGPCNTMLGCAKDDKRVLLGAIRYIANWESEKLPALCAS